MELTKIQLRRSLKRARLALSPEARQTKSTAIAGRLWETIRWSQVSAIHCFEPLERLGEVDITDFINALQAEYPDLQLFTSRQVDNVWQIISLTDGKPTAEPQFDVIIVPMLGFDASLQRIGYGGGYYDCFLATQFNAKKVGVCFEIGKIPLVPFETHDILLDMIISEDHLYLPTQP